MYGNTIESLSVFMKINGSESRIWSRYGDLRTSNWTLGCVAINYHGIYQVERIIRDLKVPITRIYF